MAEVEDGAEVYAREQRGSYPGEGRGHRRGKRTPRSGDTCHVRNMTTVTCLHVSETQLLTWEDEKPTFSSHATPFP